MQGLDAEEDIHTVEIDLNKWEGVMHECDELRAENERLRGLILDYCQAATPGELIDATQALHREVAQQS